MAYKLQTSMELIQKDSKDVRRVRNWHLALLPCAETIVADHIGLCPYPGIVQRVLSGDGDCGRTQDPPGMILEGLERP